jgi:hypothetical protein
VAERFATFDRALVRRGKPAETGMVVTAPLNDRAHKP